MPAHRVARVFAAPLAAGPEVVAPQKIQGELARTDRLLLWREKPSTLPRPRCATCMKRFANRPWSILLAPREAPVLCKSLARTCSLFFPAFALAVAFAASAPLHAQQCPGHPVPAGKLVAQNISGSFTAPGKPIYDWSKSQYRMDLTKYTRGGTLTIAVTLGGGSSTAIYFLLPSDVVVAADGGPSDSFRFRAEKIQGDIPPGSPGSCTTIIYDFHPQVLIFGVSGDWNSPKGATNSFPPTYGRRVRRLPSQPRPRRVCGQRPSTRLPMSPRLESSARPTDPITTPSGLFSITI